MEIYQIQWKSTISTNGTAQLQWKSTKSNGNLPKIYQWKSTKSTKSGLEIYQIFTIPLISLPLPLPAETYKVVNTTVLPVN